MSNGRNYSVYFDADTALKFERVKAHIGKGISGTLAMLVDLKVAEMDEGVTRRQTMILVQEGLTRIESKLDRLLVNDESKAARIKRAIAELKASEGWPEPSEGGAA